MVVLISPFIKEIALGGRTCAEAFLADGGRGGAGLAGGLAVGRVLRHIVEVIGVFVAQREY